MADRYEIKGRLGRGGVGAVYQAFDHHLGRDVAIKRILPLEDTRLNHTAEESLQSEARALALLSHPNIVTIFEFGEDEKGPFVVFELIEGDTLKEVIFKGALSLVDFYALADQVLDALAAAQKLDLLHRDIKPANIMLSWLPSGKFQVKILDFGLSKFSREPSPQTLDQQGSFLGSIDYIAPEQIELKPLDQRTDLYSLGCVLYFSLTQNPPFHGKSMAMTMNNHLAGRATPLEKLRPDIPIAVSRWVMNLISLEPPDRPATALEAMKSLEEAKNTSDSEFTDSGPVAELSVPVAKAALPTDEEKALEETQQIVSTPAPEKSPVLHGDSSVSRQIRPQPAARHLVSNKVVFLLAGILAALVIVGGLIWAEDRKDKKRAVADKTNDTAAAAKPAENKPKHQFANSGRPSGLPALPAADSLVAWYSVAGNLQNDSGGIFDPARENEILGAVENAAPGANKFHLLTRPEKNANLPTVADNWNGVQSLFFLPTQKLVCGQRGLKSPALTSSQYTFTLLIKVGEDTTGNFFRPAFADSTNEYHHTPLKFHWFPGKIQIETERGESIIENLAPRQFRVVFVEVDTEKQTLRFWQRVRAKVAPLTGGSLIPFTLPGPLTLKGYEIGYLTNPPGKRIEIPAMAIHTTLLSEKQKQELANRIVAFLETE